MPIVELVAKKTLERNPDIGLDVVDLIVLLWMYSNPYDNNRRQLSSMRTVLRMSETLQIPGGGLDVTEDELTQIVLGSLQKLKNKGLVYIRSAGVHFVKGTLTDTGVNLVKRLVKTPVLRRVTAEFGNNP
ncbi:MAG: hypothetical protein AM326_06760 [Candidatus Thorarchaeota archaeon SMTZ-45]|nr:MAG: hypothetical protein AM325_05665 [Candidatus Thorarchaeota archaeon SMTZ1-45]KXH76684.1 MAG: hypothetical protein AM326_06760 [Candidatus Thorarchaeota archaeon SMTZ-45]